MVKMSVEYFEAKSVKEAVDIYQNKMKKNDCLEISAPLLNPFLRIMEIMKCECIVCLRFNNSVPYYRLSFPAWVSTEGKVSSI
jgi:hypothetical protein